jgi:hypothetical protein
MIQATATAELRWVLRPVITGAAATLEQPPAVPILQRRFHAVENPGGHNERSYFLWLDVPTIAEPEADRLARVKAENAMAASQLTLQWPSVKLFG